MPTIGADITKEYKLKIKNYTKIQEKLLQKKKNLPGSHLKAFLQYRKYKISDFLRDAIEEKIQRIDDEISDNTSTDK